MMKEVCGWRRLWDFTVIEMESKSGIILPKIRNYREKMYMIYVLIPLVKDGFVQKTVYAFGIRQPIV